MSGIDSDLIRGHIDTIILKILFEGDKYGYEICKEVEEKSNGSYELKQPTLYSCLKRLENQGLISSYWEDSDIGGKRHYYKLTESGKETYKTNHEEWLRSRQIIDNLISNSTADASSYTLVKKDEIEDLAKKAELAEKQASILEESSSLSPTSFDDEEAVIPWSFGENNNDAKSAAVVNRPVTSETEKIDSDNGDVFYTWSEAPDNDGVIVNVQSNGEVASAIVSSEENINDVAEESIEGPEVSKAQASLFEEPEVVDFAEDMGIDENELALSSDSQNEENSTLQDQTEGEQSPAPLDETHTDEIESDEDVDIMQLLGHNVRSEIDYSEKPMIASSEPSALEEPASENEYDNDAKEEEPDEEVEPFNFNMDDFVTKSRNSYFESEDINSPKPDYVAPEMKIDGLEEKVEYDEQEVKHEDVSMPSEEVAEDESDKIYEPDFSSTPVYHDFGATYNKSSSNEDDIWVDDSNVDLDQIYLNPEANDKEEDKEVAHEETNNEPEELSLFSEDIFEDNASSKAEDSDEKQFEPYNEILRQNANSSTPDFYKSTENYDTLAPKYTDEEYKEKLSSLMNYSEHSENETNKDVYSFQKSFKNYSELKADFEKEGLVVKPHHKMVKEAKDTRSYIESNKLNLISSWTSFGCIGFLLTLVFLIMNNYRASFETFDFSYKYFLIGIACLILVPAIYTIIYFINPYKKKPARYASRIYTIFAILLTVQLLIIVYCVNLQLGFYSFAQENYNHLAWVVPCIIALYPLADALFHTIYFNSKNFHV